MRKHGCYAMKETEETPQNIAAVVQVSMHTIFIETYIRFSLFTSYTDLHSEYWLILWNLQYISNNKCVFGGKITQKKILLL